MSKVVFHFYYSSSIFPPSPRISSSWYRTIQSLCKAISLESQVSHLRQFHFSAPLVSRNLTQPYCLLFFLILAVLPAWSSLYHSFSPGVLAFQGPIELARALGSCLPVRGCSLLHLCCCRWCIYTLQHLRIAPFWIGFCHLENSQRIGIAHLCSLHTLYTILYRLSFFFVNCCKIDSLFKLMFMVCWV